MLLVWKSEQQIEIDRVCEVFGQCVDEAQSPRTCTFASSDWLIETTQYTHRLSLDHLDRQHWVFMLTSLAVAVTGSDSYVFDSLSN